MNNKTSLAEGKIKELQQRIRDFKTGEEFGAFFRAMSRFHHYSWRNQMLILSQKPEAARVAGFGAWKRLGRHVKRGEKGIVILVPIRGVKENDEGGEEGYIRFRSGHVFDISQTEGEPLPEISLAMSDSHAEFYHTCLAYADKRGIAVTVTPELKSYGVSKGGEVVLREEANKTAMATTLVHEIAHELLHKTAERRALDRERKELEAETVAFIVCSHFGIDAPSHKYLATWQQSHEIMDSLRQVSGCSGEIIEDLCVILNQQQINQ